MGTEVTLSCGTCGGNITLDPDYGYLCGECGSPELVMRVEDDV